MDNIDWSLAPKDATHAAPRPTVEAVCWYKKEGMSWHYLYQESSGWWAPCAAGVPAHGPLTERPYKPAPEWVEGELPPIGKRVLVSIKYDHPLFDWFKGKEVEIVAHTLSPETEDREPIAIFRAEDKENEGFRYHALIAECFLPLKTARDKAIESAMGAINQKWYASDYADCITTTGYIERAVAHLVDAGWRSPEDRESGSKLDRVVKMLGRVVDSEARFDIYSGGPDEEQEPWIKDAMDLLDSIAGSRYE